MSNDTKTETIAGTNLTTIAEFNTTALALAELEQRLGKLVPDTSTPKGLAALTKDVAELRTLRTGVEKKRKELKAPLIEQEKKLDAEAARITAKIVGLEEPLKLQLDEANNRIEQARLAKIEAERVRVEALKNVIFGIRETPSSLIGKPSNIINGALVRLRTTELAEDEFAEFYTEARDALDAAIMRVQTMYDDKVQAEAEAEKTRKELEELATLRREKEERDAADKQRAAEEASRAAAEQRRKDEDAVRHRQAIHARVETIQGFGFVSGLTSEQMKVNLSSLLQIRPSDDVAFFGELLDGAIEAYDATEANLKYAIKQAEKREAEEATAKAEHERQQAALDEQRKAQDIVEAQQKAERERLEQQQHDAAKKAEADRLASLGLRQAAQAVVDWSFDNLATRAVPQCIRDLEVALQNDAKKPDYVPTAPRKRAKAVK